MIGKLTGRLDSVSGDAALIDVNGVGYVVHAAGRTLAKLGPNGGPISLLIETHVREDAINLYGFWDATERDWFRLLTTVQGVGAKVALAILSTLDAGALATAIGTQDKAAVARTSGVGPKLAQRIVTELKDKAPVFGSVDPAVVQLTGDLADKRASGPVTDAVSALVNLGYGQPQAAAAVAAAVKAGGEAAETGTLIRLALKELAR